jgi:hypothetical protein
MTLPLTDILVLPEGSNSIVSKRARLLIEKWPFDDKQNIEGSLYHYSTGVGEDSATGRANWKALKVVFDGRLEQHNMGGKFRICINLEDRDKIPEIMLKSIFSGMSCTSRVVKPWEDCQESTQLYDVNYAQLDLQPVQLTLNDRRGIFQFDIQNPIYPRISMPRNLGST